MTAPRRIAMWSGPRNISTAMMRSFGNRSDTYVCDEPLYAHYLSARPVDHPGREEILAAHESDWRKVVAWLTGPVPEGRAIFYQKHMAQHLLPEIERGWLADLTHVFLIREPQEMLTSLIAKLGEDVTVEDTGLPQQVELFRWVRARTGSPPPVLDARDVLSAPEKVLREVCGRLRLPFEDSMLRWPPGRRSTDGVWAEYWYDAVEPSTGFQPYRPKDARVADRARGLLAACREHYGTLYAERITG